MRTRSILAAAVLAAAAVLSAATPAVSHGDSVHLDVTGQQNGHVSTVATWENDHDPVTEEFAGTLSATAADGRAVGPWRLVAVPGQPGTYTTREIVPAGHWTVTVECAFPSLGHAQRELDVDATAIDDPVPAGTAAHPTPAQPTAGPTRGTGSGTAPTPAPVPTRSATSGPAATQGATAGPVRETTAATAHETTSDATTWAAVGTAVAAVLLTGAGLWFRRRRA
ncbi:hypothetical protein [Kitasatospora sp. NPDC085464]|uniref:hypothetical protein n=1 Tax=Kitasatospora sp. NPDC085464 TaxID=3364063 RepID=UPI0037CC7DD9